MRTVATRMLAVLVTLSALGIPSLSPAVAQPEIGPNVNTLTPRPGQVVAAGRILYSATAESDRRISDIRLVLDGKDVSGVSTSGSGTVVTASATTTVGPGDHIARVEFSDESGHRVARAWRFTATDRRVHRLAGADRIETAALMARDLYPHGASAAVLARADDFADALAGVPLAEALDATLLLTDGKALSPAAETELRRALVAGSEVHLLGGTAALSPALEQRVRDLGYATQRHAGADRYATSAAVARALPAGRTAVLASGVSFPDALAASAPAARDGMPILLTHPGELSEPAAQALRERQVRQVVLVGGTAAVSSTVAHQAKEIAGSVERIGGSTRYVTAAAVVNRFYDTANSLGVASGQDFPDALAGARHAAGSEMPLVLSDPRSLPDPSELVVRHLSPSTITAYGGTAALGKAPLEDVRRAALDGDVAPRVKASAPRPGEVVNSLDTVIVELNRELVLRDSSLYVEMNGREVLGVVDQGDFTDTLVFQVGRIPGPVVAGEPNEVQVTVLGRDPEGRWVHDLFSFTYVKQALSRGDVGDDVVALQRRLTDLGYWVGTPDGNYGMLTTQAVMAFEKANGLPRDGVLDRQVRDRLQTAGRPQARSNLGHVIEIDKARQILMVVRNGTVQWTFNASTGTEEYYWHDGERKFAHTPTGRYEIERQIDGMREAPLGKLWRPKYFVGGIAVHGSTSVPAYGASHGCVRVTYPAMDYIWEAGLAPLGTDVYVY